MACDGVLTPPSLNGNPLVLIFLLRSPKTFNSSPFLKLFTPPFDWKQTRCEANAQTSYPTQLSTIKKTKMKSEEIQ